MNVMHSLTQEVICYWSTCATVTNPIKGLWPVVFFWYQEVNDVVLMCTVGCWGIWLTPQRG